MNWYGFLVAMGFLAGLWTASRRAPRSGIAGERILDLGPWLIIGAIIGARLLYVIMFWRDQFADAPFFEVFKVWEGGLVYYGGLIGASLTCILYTNIRRLPLWKVADVMGPSVALGQAFGRMGCLLHGCCYGSPTNVPWSICYPQNHETHPPGGDALPVHPTPVYESLLTVGLYIGLAWLYRHKRFDGQVFTVYLLGYGVIRSIVELFRGDYPQDQLLFGGMLTPAHLVSAFILTVGIVFWIFLSRRDTPGALKSNGEAIEKPGKPAAS